MAAQRTRTEADENGNGNGNPFNVWKGLPTWLRASLIFGPLGITFFLFCAGTVTIVSDLRTGLKGWVDAQRIAVEEQTVAISKIADYVDQLAIENKAACENMRTFQAAVIASHGLFEQQQRAAAGTADRNAVTLEELVALSKRASAASEEVIARLDAANKMMSEVSARCDEAVVQQTKILEQISLTLSKERT